MIGYKLTSRHGVTGIRFGNRLQWGNNVTHSAIGSDFRLGENGVIHWYKGPELAIFMDPVHTGYGDCSRLWECKIDGRSKILTDGLKCGSKTVTTIREIKKPKISLEHRIYFAILCIRAVVPEGEEPEWDRWANDWINRDDHTYSVVRDCGFPLTKSAARAVVRVTYDTTNSALYAAALATSTGVEIDFAELAHQAMGFELRTGADG